MHMLYSGNHNEWIFVFLLSCLNLFINLHLVVVGLGFEGRGLVCVCVWCGFFFSWCHLMSLDAVTYGGVWSLTGIWSHPRPTLWILGLVHLHGCRVDIGTTLRLCGCLTFQWMYSWCQQALHDPADRYNSDAGNNACINKRSVSKRFVPEL